MADVIIDLIPVIDKLETALQQIENSDGSAEAFKQGNDELKKRKELMNQVSQAQSAEAASIGKIGTNIAKLSADTVKLGANLKRGVGEGISQALHEAGVSANQFSEALEQTGMTLEEYTRFVEEAIAATTQNQSAEESLRAEKKRLQAEIAKLILSGEQESQMFRDLVMRAGEIDDAMGDAADAIRRTGSDTRGLDNAITAATAVTAGFTVATSAAALFGDESEETQKVLLKVNAAMSLLNGLQQIQTILRNEDTKSQLAALASRIRNNAAIAVENGLQSQSAVVRGLATAAQWALNAAMAANPIGLVVAGIVALTAAFSYYISGANDAARAQANLNAQLQDSKEGLDAELKGIDRATKLRIAAMEAEGKKRSEIDKVELASLAAKQTALEAQIEADEKSIAQNEKRGASTEALSDRVKQVTDQLDDLRNESALKEFDLQKNIRDEDKKTAEERVKNAKEAREKALQVLENQLTDRKALAELSLLYVEQGGKEELDAKIKLLTAERDLELNNAKLTANQKKLLEAKYNQDVLDLRRQFAADQLKTGANIEVLIAQNRTAAFREGSAEYFEAKKSEMQAIAAFDIISVQQTEKNEELKQQKILLIQNNLNKSIDDLNKQRFQHEREEYERQTQFLNEIALRQAQRIANNPRLNEFQQFNAQQAVITERLRQIEAERAQIHQDALDGRFANDQQYQNALLKNTEDAADAQQQLMNNSWQFTAQNITSVINAAFSTLNQVSDTYFSVTKAQRDAKLQADLDALDEARQKQLATDNLTAAQKAAIDKKYDAEQKALRKKAAEDDKRQKRNQALANGFLAVTNILATMPWTTFGVAQGVAIGTALASTALQVAAIERTPTGYATGTDNASRGWHWVGEKGPELMYFNGGEKVKTHQDSLAYIDSLNKTLSQSIPTTEFGGYTVNVNGGIEIDYDKMGKAVAANMPDQTTVVHVEGIKDIVYTRNSRIEYYNNKRTA